MKTDWNKRYQTDEFVYGKAPNSFFKSMIDQLPSGNILLPAEGEGRNALYAVQKKWNVTAFDISETAKEKALALCESCSLKIDDQTSDYLQFTAPQSAFDLIALIYAHVPADCKTGYYRCLLPYLKLQGYVIFEAFSKEHRNFQLENPHAGGPKNIDMLFSTSEVEEIFKDFEIRLLEQKEIQLSEGFGHKGKASVVRFVGQKKNYL